MKALILNGMAAGDDLLASIQETMAGRLKDHGWEVTTFALHEIEIAPCLGCFGCWLRTPGRCVLHDTDEIAQAWVDSDLMVFLTPVTFGGYSSHLKKALDHLIFFALPFFQQIDGETHHQFRYDHHPNLLVLGTQPAPDEESASIFRRLVERNTVNMENPRSKVGILTADQSDATIQQEIARLLNEVEVTA
jgi:multimeric flavodoxin WrbA